MHRQFYLAGSPRPWPLGHDWAHRHVAVMLMAGVLALLVRPGSAQADWPPPAHQKPVVTIVPPPGTPPPPVYGFPSPSYRFGWWNTNYWSRKTIHHGFYGDYWQWGYQPGY